MLTFTDDEFKASIQDDTGHQAAWAAEAFADLDDDVRQSIAPDQGAARSSRTRTRVRGFVYDVETGRLREVPES